ncbi:hypothetical protein DDZ14_02450 [Maritimibacter sp. 55A14]|nr:hypothetical protein DDZ14_02450 [Maritimibacter sp. 55A14]
MLLAVVGVAYAHAPNAAHLAEGAMLAVPSAGTLMLQSGIAAGGAGLAGYFFASHFGAPGIYGWLAVLVAAPVTTLVGGALGGALFSCVGVLMALEGGQAGPSGSLDLLFPAAAFGVVLVLVWATQYLWLPLLWLVMMVAVHLIARRWRHNHPGGLARSVDREP